RLEELLRLIEKEIERMGFYEVRGGYVLTGGTVKMPGVLELAQDVFHANARIAIPDYIGVREPQYTVGVGTIQFAYRNARIQGKELYPSLIVNEQANKGRNSSNQQTTEEEPKQSKVANFFKSFFE